MQFEAAIIVLENHARVCESNIRYLKNSDNNEDKDILSTQQKLRAEYSIAAQALRKMIEGNR